MKRQEFLRFASRMPDALMLVSAQGEVLAFNAAARKLLQPLTADATGRTLYELAHSPPGKIEDSLRLWAGSGQLVYGPAVLGNSRGIRLRCEGAVLRMNGNNPGSDHPFLVRLKPHAAAVHRFVALNEKIKELSHEIRARLHSETKAHERREWLQVTLSSIGDAVIATDVTGAIEFMNPVAERITGWRSAEAVGRPLEEVFVIINENSRKPVFNPVSRVLAEGIVVGLANHTVLITKDDREIAIEDSAAPIHDRGGRIRGVVLVFQDASERRLVERELERARDEALAAMRARDDFLAALSHELRTPLNPVLLIASESANDPDLPSEVREDFATIRKNVELEARLIDDLLDLTRIARGKLALDLRTHDVHAILEESFAVVRSELDEKRLAFSARLEAGESKVTADAVRLQQVFWNVLQNAVKFTPAGGSVSVQTCLPAGSGMIEVVVTDSGMGMEPEETEEIFDAFAQGRHAIGGEHRFGGIGLGLAISRMVVEMHGGSIRAASPGSGKGSTFTIRLPLCAGEGGAGTAPPTTSTTVRSGRTRSSERILLVEDHQPTQQALTRLLNRRAHSVATASSVAEALRMAASQRFTLVISDIGLPDGNGWELMRELRTRHNLHGIAMTGFGAERDVARGQEAGFLLHLTKPVNVGALDAALAAAALRRREDAGDQKI